MSLNSKLYNLAWMTTETVGLGTLTLGSAVRSYLSFDEAGVQNGDTVTYAIEEGTSREIGYGVYDAVAKTLTRNVLKSTNDDHLIDLTGGAIVCITIAAENIERGDISGATAPTFAVTGDLWFDTTISRLMIYNGTTWEGANNVIVGATLPKPAKDYPAGTLNFNTTDNRLYMFTGTDLVARLTGPMNRSSLGATEPELPNTIGDIWWSDDGPKIWNGTAWQLAPLGS